MIKINTIGLWEDNLRKAPIHTYSTQQILVITGDRTSSQGSPVNISFANKKLALAPLEDTPRSKSVNFLSLKNHKSR